jgi:acetolactate synthase-1/3 small subunit
MKYIYALSVVTENTARVLQRMAGIFARNRLNIEQLTVFETSNKGTSFFNIVIHSDEKTMARAIQQLQRIVELLEVKINSKILLDGFSEEEKVIAGDVD